MKGGKLLSSTRLSEEIFRLIHRLPNAIINIFYQVLDRMRQLLHLPLYASTVMVGLTYRCQCHCVHCGVKEGSTYRRELNYLEVTNIIDTLSKLGARMVYFFGGEPLLVKEIFQLIGYAKGKGMQTRIDTNGLLLTEEVAYRLSLSGLDYIGVSIDSPIGEEHDKIRGVPGIFDRAIKGIEYCKRQGIRCYISTYITKDALKNGKLAGIILLSERLGVEVRILIPACTGNLDSTDGRLIFSNIDVELLKSYLRPRRVYWGNIICDSRKTTFVCTALERLYLYISPYGDVQPCCYIPVSFGNVREESLDVIVKKMWSLPIFSSGRRVPERCIMNTSDGIRNFHLSLSKD